METLTQRWDASLYDGKHAFVAQYADDLIDLLAPQPGERILDLGCGTGVPTHKIAAAGASVVGMDNAASMIEQARRSYPGLEFVLADGANFALDERFDAVFSNAALHWMKAADSVAACVWQALKPGGRFVAEFGGKGNAQGIVAALYSALAESGYAVPIESPWYFPTPAEYATLLERQGFRVTYLAHFDRPTPLEDEDGLRNWLKMFANAVLDTLPPDGQEVVMAQVEDRLRLTQYQDGRWIADYVRLRLVALKSK